MGRRLLWDEKETITTIIASPARREDYHLDQKGVLLRLHDGSTIT
jgi:hypothetical protein